MPPRSTRRRGGPVELTVKITPRVAAEVARRLRLAASVRSRAEQAPVIVDRRVHHAAPRVGPGSARPDPRPCQVQLGQRRLDHVLGLGHVTRDQQRRHAHERSPLRYDEFGELAISIRRPLHRHPPSIVGTCTEHPREHSSYGGQQRLRCMPDRKNRRPRTRNDLKLLQVIFVAAMRAGSAPAGTRHQRARPAVELRHRRRPCQPNQMPKRQMYGRAWMRPS